MLPCFGHAAQDVTSPSHKGGVAGSRCQRLSCREKESFGICAGRRELGCQLRRPMRLRFDDAQVTAPLTNRAHYSGVCTRVLYFSGTLTLQITVDFFVPTPTSTSPTYSLARRGSDAVSSIGRHLLAVLIFWSPMNRSLMVALLAHKLPPY